MCDTPIENVLTDENDPLADENQPFSGERYLGIQRDRVKLNLDHMWLIWCARVL